MPYGARGEPPHSPGRSPPASAAPAAHVHAAGPAAVQAFSTQGDLLYTLRRCGVVWRKWGGCMLQLAVRSGCRVEALGGRTNDGQGCCCTLSASHFNALHGSAARHVKEGPCTSQVGSGVKRRVGAHRHDHVQRCRTRARVAAAQLCPNVAASQAVLAKDPTQSPPACCAC